MQNQKQEPHTKMWGIGHAPRKLDALLPFGCVFLDLLAHEFLRPCVGQSFSPMMLRSRECVLSEAGHLPTVITLW